jgi:hypothetical protein
LAAGWLLVLLPLLAWLGWLLALTLTRGATSGLVDLAWKKAVRQQQQHAERL